MFDKVVKSTVPGQVIEQIKELLVKGELKDPALQIESR